MTREEIKAKSLNAEIEKLNTRRERNIKTLEKKSDAADKADVFVSEQDFLKIRDTLTPEQISIYIDLSIARDDLADTEKRIEKLTASAKKAIAAATIKVERISAEEAERRAAEEVKRWAADGITVTFMSTNLIAGTTPNGAPFRIEGNNGITERSRHCFALAIGTETVFTSGEFVLAYKIVKRS